MNTTIATMNSTTAQAIQPAASADGAERYQPSETRYPSSLLANPDTADASSVMRSGGRYAALTAAWPICSLRYCVPGSNGRDRARAIRACSVASPVAALPV